MSALRIRQQPPPATARAQRPPQPGPLQQQNQAAGCQDAPARSRAPEGGRENEGPDKRQRVVQVTPRTLNRVSADVDSTENCASQRLGCRQAIEHSSRQDWICEMTKLRTVQQAKPPAL